MGLAGNMDSRGKKCSQLKKEHHPEMSKLEIILNTTLRKYIVKEWI
jgi:hypothetical protein